MKVFAIIPSGGIGKRINNPLPKQYIKFHGKELIAYTLQAFQDCDLVDEIIVASQKQYSHLIEDIKTKFRISKLSRIVEGGAERQHSVFNAVKSLNAHDDDIILVHDGVRPLVSERILVDSINTAKEFGSSVTAIKARDTLINGNGLVNNYVGRDKIYYAQTPQTFKFHIFRTAMEKAESEEFLGTDESMLVKRAGFDIKIVEGSSLNLKITSEDDIKLFEKLTENR